MNYNLAQPSVTVAEFPAAGPSAQAVSRIKALRLDQLMLFGTVMLVVAIVSLSGALQAISTRKEFNDAAKVQQARIEEQARNIERLLTHLISTTSASALRDNDYAFLSQMAALVVTPDSGVSRVRILDGEGHTVADTDGLTQGVAPPVKMPERTWVPGEHKGHSVLEYREPIEYDPNRPKGAVILAYSLEPLQAELARLEQAKRMSVQRITIRTVMLGLAFVLIGAVLAAFQSRRVTQPLGALTREALRLAEGDMEARVAEAKNAGSEVLTLGIVFNHMADQISVLLNDVRAKAQLDHQLQVARAVQESLLPERAPFEFGPLRLAGVVRPADQCGGDWWLHTVLDDGRIAIGIGDATGHGLSTALIAAAGCSGFAASAHIGQSEGLSTATMMGALNRTLFLIGRGRYQTTCAIAIFDPRTGELEISNAGHPFPFVYHRPTRQISALIAKGPRIGDSYDAIFTAARARLTPGDMIVWYTDGIIEAENALGAQYGAKRLRQAIERNGQLPAEQVRDAIRADVETFLAATNPNDDMTVVVAEYDPRRSTRRP